MAKKIEIEVDVTGNVVESTKNLKAMKQELKGLDVGSKEFKKLFNEIDDLEDKIKSAKNVSSDWVDSLQNAGGPLGMVGTGLNKLKVATQSFGAALKATGIGLVVSLIGMLVAAFSQTEGSMKKLEPLMIMLEKLFGGLVEAFTPLIESFADIAIKVLPVFITGIKNVYGGLMAFFTLIKEAGTGVGKILKGIFTFDTKSINEGYDQLKGSWEKTKESFNEFTNNFEKGYAKQTKTQKENSKKSKEDADKALADRIKNMETNDKLDQSELEKQKQLALAEAFNDEQRLFVEEKFYQKSYELRKKDLEDKQKLYKVETNEYKELQIQLNTLDAERIGKVKEFKDKDKEIRDKNSKEIIDFEIQLAKDLQKIEDDKRAKKLDKDIKDKGDRDAIYARIAQGVQNDLDLQRYMLEEKKKADEQYYKDQLAREGITAEQIRELNDKKLADQIFYTEKSNQIERDRISVKQKALDDIISIVGAESEIGRAALLAKQILNAKELVMEVSKTITFSTQAAARSVVAVAEGTAQTAKIGFPQNIPMLIGYAAQAVGIISAIMSAVNSAKSSSATTTSPSAPPSLGQAYAEGGLIEGPRHAGGGVMINAEGGEAVMTRGAVTMFNPLLSMMNQMGGGVSFSKGATGQASYDSPRTTQVMTQPQIIKTYVVSSEMTTDQHRQARLKDLSTL